MNSRSGIGFDIHPLKENLPLILGGISIDYHKGLSGHSDGDVLIHAIIDALLGGAGLGDIGTHFPPSDVKYKNISSTKLLAQTIIKLENAGWQIHYVDATILAEQPVLNSFVDRIRHNISKYLKIRSDLVNVKTKTTNGLGTIGNGDGIASICIATINKQDETV